MDQAVQQDRVWLGAYPPGVPAQIDVTRYESLVQAFDEWIGKYRERAAFVSLGSDITYAQVETQARAFAAWLQSRGVRKGDRVALMMPNCLQYPICLFGTLIAGAVVVNVNPLYTVRELSHQLRDCGARTIVVFENFAKTLQASLQGTDVRDVVITQIGDLLGDGLNAKGRLVNFIMRRVAKQVPPYDLPQAIPLKRALADGAKARSAQGLTPVPLTRDDLAFLQYTGGTTGLAKGAMLTHGNVLANLLQAEAWIADQLTDEIETNLSLLPMYHIFSLTVNCLMFMSLGGRNILIANPRDVKKVVYIIRNETFTGVAGVNTLFNGLLEDEGFRARDFSKLKLSLAGGMATQRAIAERWKQVTGKPIIEGYGLTECSPIVTMNPVDLAHIDDMEFTGSIGLPAPSTEVRFKREDGTWADIGEPGELCVRGPQVMRGYWQRPEDTAKTFDADGWLLTGDIGVMDANGFVRLIDRKKDMILVSGFNVYPNEIEDVVMLHPGVREAAVVGVPDPVAGERVKLVVVAKDPQLTAEAMLAHCRQHLTAYKVPRIVEFRQGELPKTTVGKILRRELRDPAPAQTQPAGTPLPHASAALGFILAPLALAVGLLGAPDAKAQSNASAPVTASALSAAPSTATNDADVAKLAAMPVTQQTQWLAQTIKSGDLAKMGDEAIVARIQALNPEALVRYLKAESAALPEYQYELTRHERINNQWQTTPDRMIVKIREKPLQIYAKWLPDGAHSGQEIIYDETKNPKEMYGHLGGILGFTSIWSSIDGTLARSQSNHTVRDLGFAFIAEQIAHDGRSFRAAGLPEKPARMSVSEVNGVRVLALEWDAPSGPPQHYANKSRVLIDLKTGRPRGIEAWDASGQKTEEMRFEKVRREQWSDTTFDPKNPDYKF